MKILLLENKYTAFFNKFKKKVFLFKKKYMYIYV